ncbi:Piso0_002155 [Millerozyma farinosa CBS 7064]|uniref:Respiratory growth induced protein 1 n=1 Tax=Pichia sorbitophila (strain ATCC MYA-4447 / BCRC 22081 / CBS 7064 / NBRC 10061 / NRRL Y-12695) TaxID=559304 RepID=G8YBU8_PICSO|nr:Piso0_002155 [Millerozyma farinosa CBS 7064]
MTNKANKKSKAVELDLNNCERLEHLKEVPKSRSSSITSIESDGSLQKSIKPPPMREFEDLTSFEAYLRDETWDNEFDYCHAHVMYYPPFIMKTVHNDFEKIKPSMNKKSRKFRRNLEHHVKKHLMTEMERCSGFKMDFDKVGLEDNPSLLKWIYEDTSNHGFDDDEAQRFHRQWKVHLEVSCNNENPMVEVDYQAIPILE